MKSAGKILCMLVVLTGLVSASWAGVPQFKTVTATGVGAILSGDRALARDKALRDAQRNAVETAVGVLIDSETVSENYSVLRDEIFARSTGYIQDYKILEEKVEDQLVRMTIEARVKLAPLKEDLDRLIRRVGRPRILFLIAERDIGKDRPIAWWEGTAGMGEQIVDTTLQRYFLKRHFVVVDHSLKRPSRSVSTHLSDVDAAALGKEYDAEVVIVGQAVAKNLGRIRGYDLYSCRAEISARAIQVDNGHLLAAATAGAAAAHIDPLNGGAEALKKAAEQLGKKLSGQIVDVWAGRAATTTLLTLDIVHITRYADFVRFKGMLKDQVRGVSKVYQRKYGNGKATLELDYAGNAQDLADELALKEFPSFTVEILEATQNRLKLSFTPKNG